MTTGIHNQTGSPLSGIEHLRQSIRDILTTPLGTRIMRLDYGSRLFDLIDLPINNQTIIEIYAATAEALARWEPRLTVERVVLIRVAPGEIEINLDGEYTPTGEPIRLEGIIL